MLQLNSESIIFFVFLLVSIIALLCLTNDIAFSLYKEAYEGNSRKILAENNNYDKKKIFNFSLPNIEYNLNTKPYYIMVVDDEESCLLSMELLFYKTPYKIIKASGGIEAIKYLHSEDIKIDLILLDLMMPDISGLEVLKNIGKDQRLKNIPVILQTGVSDYSEIDKAYKLGIVNHVSKPYNRQIILSMIDKIFQQKG